MYSNHVKSRATTSSHGTILPSKLPIPPPPPLKDRTSLQIAAAARLSAPPAPSDKDTAARIVVVAPPSDLHIPSGRNDSSGETYDVAHFETESKQSPALSPAPPRGPSPNTSEEVPVSDDGVETIVSVLSLLQTPEEQVRILSTPNGRNRDTLLHLAARNGQQTLITTLLNMFEKDYITYLLSIQNDDGQTPLHLAVMNNTPESINAILEEIDLDHIDVILSIQDIYSETALCCAIKKECRNSINPILNRLSIEQFIDILSIKDSNHNTILAWIIKNSPKDIADIIIGSLKPLLKSPDIALLKKFSALFRIRAMCLLRIVRTTSRARRASRLIRMCIGVLRKRSGSSEKNLIGRYNA